MQIFFIGFTVNKWEPSFTKTTISSVMLKCDMDYRIIQSERNENVFKIILVCSTVIKNIYTKVIMLTYESESEYIITTDKTVDDYTSLDDAVKESFLKHTDNVRSKNGIFPLWDLSPIIDPVPVREGIVKVLHSALL